MTGYNAPLCGFRRRINKVVATAPATCRLQLNSALCRLVQIHLQIASSLNKHQLSGFAIENCGFALASAEPQECAYFRWLYREQRDNQTGWWSGRTMARSGLRMMPTFPSSPLRFRTAGFPQYGSKAGLSDGACPGGTSIGSLGLRPSFVSSAALNTPRSVSKFLAQHNTAVRAV